MSSTTKRKIIPAVIKKSVLARPQCENSPIVPATGCRGYRCPLWIYNSGVFDEAGCEIDHIVEVAQGGSNEITNLQVLCPSCHSVKTRRCAKTKWLYDSESLDSGTAPMEK